MTYLNHLSCHHHIPVPYNDFSGCVLKLLHSAQTHILGQSSGHDAPDTTKKVMKTQLTNGVTVDLQIARKRWREQKLCCRGTATQLVVCMFPVIDTLSAVCC